MQLYCANRFANKPKESHRLGSTFLNIFLGQTILYAHEKNIFVFIHTKHPNLATITQHMGISMRATQAVLSACCALKLVLVEDGTFRLTPLSKIYLLPDSPFSYGGVLDDLIQNNFMTSLDTLRNALESDMPQICADNHFATANQDPTMAGAFLKLMHSKSAEPAAVWSTLVDLKDADTMLDIGSGAGTHSIYACQHWPHLKAVLFDLEFACRGAEKFVTSYGLEARIHCVTGDMWTDSFPAANVHFYSDILHDWPLDRGQFLLQKSFDALPHGGRIIVHERLFNHDKTGPQSTAAYNVMMMLWTTGQQLSQGELWDMLSTAGFRNIETQHTTEDWSITIGYKA